MSENRTLGIRSTSNQIVPLTGIRFVAAALVLYTHYLVWISPIKSEQLAFLQFDSSKYGMTLFFVLSGFVIHLTYADLFRKQRLTRAALGFFVARLARLYPLYLLFILFFLVRTHGVLLRFVNEPEFRTYVLLHVLAIQSWLPFTIDGAIASNGPFHVSWSISTEIFFYLVYPAVFFALARINTVGGAVRLFAGFALLAYVLFWFLMRNLDSLSQPFTVLAQASYRGGSDSPQYWLEYVSPYGRLPEFLCGAIAAHVFSLLRVVKFTERDMALIRRSAYVAFPLAWAVLLLIQNYSPFAVFLSRNFLMAPLISVFLVFVALDKENLFSRWLSVWPLFILGEVSYSIYLLHPSVSRLIDIPSNTYDLSSSSVLLFMVSLSLLLGLLAAFSIGTYLIWERPARRLIRALAGDRLKKE